MTREQRIKDEAAKDARTYCDEFPGQPPDDHWAASAYEMIDSHLVTDGDYGRIYWPAFEAMATAINKRRAGKTARPRTDTRTITMPAELWEAVLAEAKRREPTTDQVGRRKAWSASAVICDAVRKTLEKEGA